MINTKGTNGRRNNRSCQPVKGKAPRVCSCCYKCLHVVIGFVLLLVVTGSITLIRGFLEVPIILNGFAPNRPAQTSVATSLGSTIKTTSPTYSSNANTSQVRVTPMSNSTAAAPNYSTQASHNFSSVTNSSMDAQIHNTGGICSFVGELKVNQNTSIQLNSNPNSSEYINVAEAVERKINIAYRSSALKMNYVATKLIGISPVYSAIRFWMFFWCSVTSQEEKISEIFQQNVDNIIVPDNGQLKVHINSEIKQCQDSMPTCASGYCINKTNMYCDDVDDCWNGSDEALCECKGSSAAGCPSMVTLIGKKYSNPCHGSLIASEWVLTSSRCANDSSFSDICTAGSPRPTKYKIKKRHIVDGQGEGIALLHLSTAVDSTLVQPIPLPDSSNQTETTQTICRITPQSNSKYNVKWRVIASNERTITMRKNFSNLRCCQVEGGSPLMCLNRNNTWVLTAVRDTSFKYTTKYKRINNFLSLIKYYINRKK
ncbi:uncharacterized protein LOC119974658 isoform X2 [Scyliorhinus canicula]|uniref:uncharacterized protein LOC119974658 isoform X2 n=1 Tax=Scyliorhinus canicula TaxID=7830 RepID=UPI0018F33760|nr:uncharacterized protein LOC119974658 isoform X2 [Scyliorhinus canicula]